MENARNHIIKIKNWRKIQRLIVLSYVVPAAIYHDVAYNFGYLFFVFLAFIAANVYISSLLYCPYCGERFSKSLKSTDVPKICPHCNKNLNFK